MESIKDVEGFTLSELWDVCYNAHRNTSFSAAKRAYGYIREYSAMLDEDLKELGNNQGNYKEKFIAKFSDWMEAKSRCISSMITGPSGFPVNRARKANDSERKKGEAFFYWRKKYFKAVNRVPTKSPEEELETTERKLEVLLNNREEYKKINSTIKKCEKLDLNHQEVLKHLTEKGYSLEALKLIEYIGGKYLIPAFMFYSETIRRSKDKVRVMTNRIRHKNSWEDILFDGGRVTIADDRLKIFHDEKPSKEVILEIKSNGFRWSPNWKCWCRKHTGNAIYALKQLSFIKTT